MNQPKILSTAMRILLVAGLVGINACPFFVNGTTSYEYVFLSLSAIHAELCLFLAWCIFADKRQRLGRVFWCLLGIAATVICAMRLLAGKGATMHPWSSLQIGVWAIAICAMPMIAIFYTQRFLSGTVLVADATKGTTANQSSFPLTKLFALIICCAFLSLLLRSVIRSPNGWLVPPVALSDVVMTCCHSFAIGLLSAPSALVVLKPNRFSIVWLFYFVAFAAVQPIAEGVVSSIFKLQPAGVSVPWTWTDLIETVTYYGPELLPTFVLFVMLRLAGVRVQDTK